MKKVFFGSYDLAHSGHVERFNSGESEETTIVIVNNPQKINQSSLIIREEYLQLQQAYSDKVFSNIEFAQNIDDILCFAKNSEKIIRGYRNKKDKLYDFELAKKNGLLAYKDKLEYVEASDFTKNISSSKLRVLKNIYPSININNPSFLN